MNRCKIKVYFIINSIIYVVICIKLCLVVWCSFENKILIGFYGLLNIIVYILFYVCMYVIIKFYYGCFYSV